MSTENGTSSSSTTSSSPAFSVYSPSHAALSPSHPPRILSIQSSVVYGYVGNKASNFPLQLLGFDVDPIHTCQLSNHTGYKSFTGRRTSGEELAELIKGLKGNGMMKEYGCVVSGYMSNVDLMERWVQIMKEMASEGQVRLYLCDPVMGDAGRMYVPAEFVSLYSQLLPFAHVLTPNQTEAELLTGRPIESIDAAVQACEALHAKGVKLVIITSMTLKDEHSNGQPSPHPSHLHIVATQSGPLFPSSPPTSTSHSISRGYYHMRLPHLTGYWSGTGDLTASLLLGWLWWTEGDLAQSLSMTISAVQAVMERTQKGGGSELQLIACQDAMRRPKESGIPIYEPEWKERTR